MKKHSIILATVAAAFYFWTARETKNKSDSLLSRFKEVDSSLSVSTDSINNSNGVGSVQQVYLISQLKSQIILLIDSLKESYQKIEETSSSTTISKTLKSDTIRLLKNIQEFNKTKWNIVDSQIPDTIKYWARSDKFSEEKWHFTFESSQQQEILIYLNYLRDRIISVD